MKDPQKLNKLTNNPISLLFGLNHKYLNRTFTMFFRIGLTLIVLLLTLFLVTDGGKKDILLLPVVLWAFYFLIDKLRIKNHLRKYNLKFQEGLDFLKSQQYLKSFKKFIKLGGLKEPIFWIVDNEPQVLLGSLSDKIDGDLVKKITKQIENKDIDGVISSFRKIAMKSIF